MYNRYARCEIALERVSHRENSLEKRLVVRRSLRTRSPLLSGLRVDKEKAIGEKYRIAIPFTDVA